MDQLRALLSAPRPSGLGLISGGLLLVAAYAATLAWAMDTQTYSVWGGLIVVPVVVAINLVLIWRAVRQQETWFAWLLPIAYLAKLAGVVARYYVAYVVYDGVADASRYNSYAAAHYRLWREGAIVWELGGSPGTKFLEISTTAVYTVTGPTPFGGFVVFGSLAFWGAYLIFRAFSITFPDGERKRYALLLFFLPSMIYWPASIGKESWILLFVGVTALGAARFFTNARGWLPLIVIGAVGISLVRPHVAVLVFAALLVAQLFRPASQLSLGVLSKVAGVAVLAAAAFVLATQSAGFLGIDDLSTQAVVDELAEAGLQTQMGGSAFNPIPLNSPLGVPTAIATMLYRPFPWDGGNFQMVLQGIEGLFLLGLTVLALPRMVAVWGIAKRSTYLVFCVVYTLAYILAFSQFGNFGIVARQRVLMLPFFLVLLALPALAERRTIRATRAGKEESVATNHLR